MITDEELNAQPANNPNKPNIQSLSSRNTNKWRFPDTNFNRPFSWSSVGAGADVAWERGFDGRGATLAVVDVGVTEGHPLLGDLPGAQQQKIRNPISKSVYTRKFTRMSAYPNCLWPGSWETCTDDGFSYGTPIGFSKFHGAAMMSITSGAPNNTYYKPRKDEEYWGTGVAYGANLLSLRASNMYFIQGAKRKIGIRRAFKLLANFSFVKVISMSMGSFWYDTGIARAIQKAYRSGKMIFTAAGTAPRDALGLNLASMIVGSPEDIFKKTNTLFPSNLREVYAVTGVFRNTWCYACYGKADFTVDFQEANIRFDEGSSSRATAVMAGIATLIWGSNLNMSRTQVYNRMRQLSQRPNWKHRYFGHGNIDLSGFYGANKPIKKAKNLRFYSPDFPNSYFTLGGLDKNNNASVLFSKSGHGSNRQRFKVIELKDNTIALKASNGRYIGVDKNGNLKASGFMISKNQKFKIHTNNYGKRALQCYNNGKFVTFKDASDGSPVRCISPTADDKFTWFEMD